VRCGHLKSPNLLCKTWTVGICSLHQLPIDVTAASPVDTKPLGPHLNSWVHTYTHTPAHNAKSLAAQLHQLGHLCLSLVRILAHPCHRWPIFIYPSHCSDCNNVRMVWSREPKTIYYTHVSTYTAKGPHYHRSALHPFS